MREVSERRRRSTRERRVGLSGGIRVELGEGLGVMGGAKEELDLVAYERHFMREIDAELGLELADNGINRRGASGRAGLAEQRLDAAGDLLVGHHLEWSLDHSRKGRRMEGIGDSKSSNFFSGFLPPRLRSLSLSLSLVSLSSNRVSFSLSLS